MAKKKQGFFKRNWDIILAYPIFLLSYFLMLIFLQSCYDWGCIGLILLPTTGSAIMNILFFIGIIRTFRNKKLSRIRWIWLLVPMVIGSFAQIFDIIISSGLSGGITSFLGFLGPLTAIFILWKLFLFQQAFTIVGDSTISQITIQQFQQVLSRFPYLNEGIERLLGVQNPFA